MLEFKAQTVGIAIAIVAAMFLIIAGGSWISGISKNMSENIKNAPKEENGPLGLPKSEQKENDEKTNILLLGIGGPDHISGSLTDTLILMSVGANQEKADLISIPRDLWVFYDSKDYPAEGISGFTYDEGWQKINEIYYLSGGQEKPNIEVAQHISKKVAQITGQPVHYTVIINLDGVEKIVDLLGGVEVEEVQMTGKEAVSYIRDRSGPGSDFDRMKNQQRVLVAIQKKLGDSSELGFAEILELYNTVQENIVMDAGLSEFLGFYDLLGKIDPENTNMYTIAIVENNLLTEEYIDIRNQKIYILRPSAGKGNYEEIQKYINKILSNS